MYQNAIELDGISKGFAGHTAVRRLSLTVPRGGIYGLLGPNGAGKSTTIRMILNIIAARRGEDDPPRRRAGRAATLSERIGYLPEERGLYKKMKVRDHLIFLGEAQGAAERRAAQAQAAVARAAGPRRLEREEGARSSPRGCSRRCSSSAPCCTSRSW